MELNLNKLIMTFSSIVIIVISFCKLFNSEKNLPNILQGVVQYGKFAEKQEYPDKYLKVPKRYFRHFYSFAAPIFTITLCLAMNKYFFRGPIPDIIYTILDVKLGSSRKASVSPEATMLAITLMTIHVWKRFYESHYVSIFSKAPISIMLYIIGFVHYSVLVSTIVGDSYDFVRASYEQLQTNIILANLRKNQAVDTESYKIPMGRLFNYISTPLQFTEIVIYLTLAAILWESSTIYYITVWVFTNQTANGIFQHQWYIQKFENYPKQRKIIFPFLF